MQQGQSAVSQAGQKTPKHRFSFSWIQGAYMGGAAASFLFGVWIVNDQLGRIVADDPDIFYAPLIGLSVFLLTKAFEPRKQALLAEEAMDLIRDRASPDVEMALNREFVLRSQESAVYRNLAVLERNVDAAIDRLREYYNTQTTELGFYEHLPLLLVVADDLDKSRWGIEELQRSLQQATGVAAPDSAPRAAVDPDHKVQLQSVVRSVKEAINRRNEAYLAFVEDDTQKQSFERRYQQSFKIITSDLFKAYKILNEMVGRSGGHAATDLELKAAQKYVDAAITRSLALVEARFNFAPPDASQDIRRTAQGIAQKIEYGESGEGDDGFTFPTAFGVMISDMANASYEVDAMVGPAARDRAQASG